MAQMQQMQEQMQKQLAAQSFDGEAGGKAVTVTVSGAREVLNVKIDTEQIDLEDTEGLEDLIVVATNRALEKGGGIRARPSGQHDEQYVTRRAGWYVRRLTLIFPIPGQFITLVHHPRLPKYA